MEIGAEGIVYVLIFIGILLAVEGIYLFAFGKSISLSARMNRRLELLEKGKSREAVLQQLRREMDRHRQGLKIPLYAILADKATKGGIAFSPQAILMLMAGLAGAAFMAMTFLTEAPLPVRLLLSVAMGVGGIYVWISHRAKKRVSLIEEQLPDAIELMVRSLRVGHPLINAIGIAAREVPDPLGTEFGIIADEAAYGGDVAEAIKAFAERMDLQDLRFLAVAVAIQQQSGGNLAEILEGLAKVIRARFKLFRRVKAITAEAKWSGMFLSAFPIVALIMITLIKPDYFDDVKKTAYFIPAAIAVGVFLILNLVFMRMMVNIKV